VKHIICVITINIVVIFNIDVGTLKGLTKASSSSGNKSVDVKHITASDLGKKSNQHLNVQVKKSSQMINSYALDMCTEWQC